MRFIHTADWHLGRLFHGVHLTDDQRFSLQGLVRLAEERQVDAVVIAGDVFDRAVPPTEAVDLLDDIVATLALDLGVQVVMIAGNHDSPVRLEYLSGLVRRAGVHVTGRVGAIPAPALLKGADGAHVRFWPLAYTDPEMARYELGRDDIHTHEAAMRAQLESVAPQLGGADLDVLVGHAFVLGCRESESERPLTVGGSGAVPVSLFEGFDYVALGHLHQPQTAGSERVRYAGSLLKYSFDEVAQRKSVTVVDLGAGGALQVEEVSLPVKRDAIRVRGCLAELAEASVDPALADAYVEVILTDREAVLDPVEKLRRVFPYLLSLRREEAAWGACGPGPARTVIRTRSTLDLFADFFAEVRGDPLSESQSEFLTAVLTEMERQEREVAAG
jgi:exonuclease SbcD